MEKKTLKQLFESQQEVLAQQLVGLSLPKDTKKVQEVTATYMAELFDRNGEFRQSLTQSEDYILQAALSLLNAQRSMIGELSKVNDIAKHNLQDYVTEQSEQDHSHSKSHPILTIGGSAIGGTAGAIVFGTWGAVFGAIAGTAIAIYSSTRLQTKASRGAARSNTVQTKGTPIDPNVFIGIVDGICESVDNLIMTYQVQVRRLKNSYESQEKPSLLKDYSSLISQIENVCRAAESTSDNAHAKLLKAISMMAEVLENYDLKYENGKIGNIKA